MIGTDRKFGKVSFLGFAKALILPNAFNAVIWVRIYLFLERCHLPTFIAHRYLLHVHGLEMAKNVKIGAGLRLPHPRGVLLTKGMHIGENVSIYGNVRFTRIWDEVPRIGSDVLIGDSVVFTGKGKVGNHVIVGAGSVVTGRFPDNVVIGGNPARILKENRVTEDTSYAKDDASEHRGAKRKQLPARNALNEPRLRPAGRETRFALSERTAKDELADQILDVYSHPVISAILETVGGLLAVFNEHRQLVALNGSFMGLFRIDDAANALGLRLGEALNCPHADEGPAGCGTAKSCSICGPTAAMVASLADGGIVEKEGTLSVERGGEKIEAALLIRSNPVQIKGKKYILLFMQETKRQ